MCEPGGKPDGKSGLISGVYTSLSIIRSSKLPWYRIVAVAVANIWRRFFPLRECCGNLGHPGC